MEYIPEVVRSDNGPQFDSAEFAKFAKEWKFEHVTSSPRYAQSNGELTPKWPDLTKLKMHEEEKKQVQADYFNSRHRTRPLK